ncbi:MAG: AAA family ATPase [Saprospiraceae bacterium]|nr:AAA family ATPase [Saprospiraceae bacterium]
MYLQSLEINNFRKFGTKNNKIEFVQSDYKKATSASTEQNNSQSFVACATTLIIGKNNAGKTTVTKALKQIIEPEKITGATFNLSYVKNLFDQYTKVFSSSNKNDLGELEKVQFEAIELPTMMFKLNIGLDSDPKTISVQNLKQFIPIENNEIHKVIALTVKFLIKEDEKYRERVQKLFYSSAKRNISVKFNEFLKIIDITDFVRHVFDIKGRRVGSNLFNLRDLIDLKIIKANLDDGETSLSSVFNKIVQYRLRDEDDTSRIKLENEISKINGFMDSHIGKSHHDAVNKVVNKITDKQNMLVHLRSDLDFKSLFSKLITYEFEENNNFIPEKQFGLGYSNLMKILGQIIDYVEQYEKSETHDKVNLICIEEPENFMHPQMQELFIKNIDDALTVLLGTQPQKNINSQLIITTHSSHIVNSKIHSSNTFNNINYITTGEENFSHVVTLNDNKISGNNISLKAENRLNDLKFLKKHIKYKVSELFFSDAVILVEGITEEHLLQHYINESEALHKHSISLFNINGAYAHIYKPLIDLLKVPCLVITDLDIKRDPKDKGKTSPALYKQISSLNGHETTNAVLHKYICNEKLSSDSKEDEPKSVQLPDEDEDEDESKSVQLPDELDYFSEDNFKIVFQKELINGYIATSFEEAFILTNYDNDTLNSVLEDLKPRIYKRIVGKKGKENKANSRDKSFEWQCKLASSKSSFANTLLYKIITSDNNAPPLPKYIEDGLTWLTEKLDNRFSQGKVD